MVVFSEVDFVSAFVSFKFVIQVVSNVCQSHVSPDSSSTHSSPLVRQHSDRDL